MAALECVGQLLPLWKVSHEIIRPEVNVTEAAPTAAASHPRRNRRDRSDRRDRLDWCHERRGSEPDRSVVTTYRQSGRLGVSLARGATQNGCHRCAQGAGSATGARQPPVEPSYSAAAASAADATFGTVETGTDHGHIWYQCDGC